MRKNDLKNMLTQLLRGMGRNKKIIGVVLGVSMGIAGGAIVINSAMVHHEFDPSSYLDESGNSNDVVYDSTVFETKNQNTNDSKEVDDQSRQDASLDEGKEDFADDEMENTDNGLTIADVNSDNQGDTTNGNGVQAVNDGTGNNTVIRPTGDGSGDGDGDGHKPGDGTGDNDTGDEPDKEDPDKDDTPTQQDPSDDKPDDSKPGTSGEPQENPEPTNPDAGQYRADYNLDELTIQISNANSKRDMQLYQYMTVNEQTIKDGITVTAVWSKKDDAKQVITESSNTVKALKEAYSVKIPSEYQRQLTATDINAEFAVSISLRGETKKVNCKVAIDFICYDDIQLTYKNKEIPTIYRGDNYEGNATAISQLRSTIDGVTLYGYTYYGHIRVTSKGTADMDNLNFVYENGRWEISIYNTDLKRSTTMTGALQYEVCEYLVRVMYDESTVLQDIYTNDATVDLTKSYGGQSPYSAMISQLYANAGTQELDRIFCGWSTLKNADSSDARTTFNCRTDGAILYLYPVSESTVASDYTIVQDGKNQILVGYSGNSSTIDVPYGVTRIAMDKSFVISTEAQNQVTRIVIPATVSDLDLSAVGTILPKLGAYEVSSGSTRYESDEQGILYEKGRKKLLRAPSLNATAIWTVPESVTEISTDAFADTMTYLAGQGRELTVSFASLVPPKYVISNVDFHVQVPDSDPAVELVEDSYLKTYAASWGSMIDDAAKQVGYALEHVIGTASGAQTAYYNAGNTVYSINATGQKVLEYVPTDAPEEYTLDASVGITAIDSYAFNGATDVVIAHIPSTITTFMPDCFVTLNQQNMVGVVVEGTHTTKVAEDIIGDEDKQNPYLHIFIDSKQETSWKEQLNYQESDTYLIADEGTVVMEDHCMYLKNEATERMTLYSVQQDCTSYYAPKELTMVGSNAFVMCSNLTEIVLPNVTRLEEKALAGCSKLEILVLESSKQITVEEDFTQCQNLKMILSYASNAGEELAECETAQVVTDDAYAEKDGIIYQHDSTSESYNVILAPTDVEGIVQLREGTTMIAKEAFAGCTRFTGFSPEQWDNITSIGECAFDSCTQLEGSLTLRAERIGKQAFHGCVGITQIYLNTGITSMDDEAFADCTALRYLYWNADTTQVGKRVFVGCNALSSVAIGETPTETASLDERTVVTTIGDYTFQGCDNIGALTLHTSIRQIGDYAFDGCSKLQITREEFTDDTDAGLYIQSIGDYAFQGCEEIIAGVRGMDNLEEVGAGAFKDCVGIMTEIIPENLTEISDYCYMGCTKLQRIYCSALSSKSNKLRKIGTAAFAGCGNLNRVYYLDAQKEFTEIGDLAFSAYELSGVSYGACTSLESIQLPDNITRIGDYAFKGDVLLDSIDFAKAVKLSTIGKGAFADCTTLREAYLTTTSVTMLTEDSFNNCNNLMTLLLPASCEKVYTGALDGCDKLQVILLQNKKQIVELEAGALGSAGDNDELIVFVPQTDEQILKQEYAGDSSWNEATGMRSEELLREIPAGDGVTIDGAGVYVTGDDGSYTLSAVFPSTSGVFQMSSATTKVSADAFSDCRHITMIVTGAYVDSLPDQVFAGCENLEAVIVNEREVEGATFTPLTLEGQLFAADEERKIKCYVEAGTLKYYTDTSKMDVRSFGSSYRVDSDVLYGRMESQTDANGALTLLYVPRSYNGSLTLYQGTEAIAAEAAKDCTQMTAVDIVITVRNIGDAAFSGCRALQTAYIHNETGTLLDSIGADAFNGCSALVGRNSSNAKRITIPTTVTSIGARAFKDCSSLTYISMQGRMTEIADETFSGCTKLATFTGSATQLAMFTRIGEKAFYNNTSQVSLSWTNMANLTEVADSAYEGCSKVILATFADKLTKIGNRAFYGTNMKSISFNGANPPELGSEILTPEILDTIKIYVPLGDEGTAVVDRYKSGWAGSYQTMAGNVSGLNGKAFRMVSNVLYIVNPNDSAELTAVKVPDTLSAVTFYNTISSSTRLYCIGLADDSLRGCNLLQSIIITNNIKNIGDRVFADCSALSTVTIDGNVLVSIGNNAFARCSSLKSLTLPASVGSIGDGLLEGVPEFTTLELKGEIPADLGSKIFGDTLPEYVRIKVPYEEDHRTYDLYMDSWGTQLDAEYGEGTALKIFYAQSADGKQRIENGISTQEQP